jgi:hypothetical protein
MILLGIAGRKGSGKDTLASSLLQWWLNPESLIKDGAVYHMADPMKDLSINFFGLNHASVYGTQEQKESPIPYAWGQMPTYSIMVEPKPPSNRRMTGREFLQYFGTEICRTMDPMIHAHATMKKIASDEERSIAIDYLAVVADLRFPNECDAIRKRGGKIVLLTRSGDPKIDDHSSENSLNGYSFDAVIDNTFMTKMEQLDAIIKYLKESSQLS